MDSTEERKSQTDSGNVEQGLKQRLRSAIKKKSLERKRDFLSPPSKLTRQKRLDSSTPPGKVTELFGAGAQDQQECLGHQVTTPRPPRMIRPRSMMTGREQRLFDWFGRAAFATSDYRCQGDSPESHDTGSLGDYRDTQSDSSCSSVANNYISVRDADTGSSSPVDIVEEVLKLGSTDGSTAVMDVGTIGDSHGNREFSLSVTIKNSPSPPLSFVGEIGGLDEERPHVHLELPASTNEQGEQGLGSTNPEQLKIWASDRVKKLEESREVLAKSLEQMIQSASDWDNSSDLAHTQYNLESINKERVARLTAEKRELEFKIVELEVHLSSAKRELASVSENLNRSEGKVELNSTLTEKLQGNAARDQRKIRRSLDSLVDAAKCFRQTRDSQPPSPEWEQSKGAGGILLLGGTSDSFLDISGDGSRIEEEDSRDNSGQLNDLTTGKEGSHENTPTD